MIDLALLPGWGFEHRVWQPFCAHLPPQFRIHFPANADALPDSSVVCGWSLGALRALRWAERYPEKVARLVLFGATPRFLQADDWRDAQPAEMLDSFAAAVAADPATALRRFAALINQGDAHARELTRQLGTQLATQFATQSATTSPDAATLADGLAELRTTDLRKSVVAIRQATLLIHGAHDPLMPLAAGRWLAEHLPAARLTVLADAAHAPFLSQPARCAALLAEFADE